MRTPHDAVLGTVSSWDDSDGVGVLLTPEGVTVWCHYSQIRVTGRQTFTVGQQVRFDYEVPGQDGQEARVLSFAEPAG